MKKFLIDTNIILDVLMMREPHYKLSYKILEMLTPQQTCISADTFTTIAYFIKKYTPEDHKKHLTQLIQNISILSVNQQIIEQALLIDAPDIEDNVQIATAYFHKLDGIITRNPHDFVNSIIPVYTPQLYLQEHT